ncbi:MAG: hypothetical protein C5B49_01955 [Bdellovibrio sp.]|nr:MAG: hypothetical protein C5B49_01955 [Bdellovibrio sp.]
MTNIIDFDDQLYLPVVYKLKFPKYDWVFIDEAQDISSIQHVMLERSLNKGGRLVAVGDSHQAIYSFRGADSNSLNKIVETFNCIRLPLSISYRCPKSVVAEAKQYVPHIEAAPTATEGSVVDSGVANNIKLYNPEESVMVVCRNNAPLLRLAYFLIAAKVPVRVEGREIGEGLANLIKKLRARTIHDLGPRLEEWHARETAKKLAVDKSADLSAIDDKYECLLCLLESTQAQTVPELINEVKNLFDPKPGKKYVICSTIHRAKGLESEKVFFLDSWRLPSKYAKTEEQLQQEHNLAYVAVTRAKQSLHYVNFPKEAK